jgi:hypothetical protein
MATIRQHAEAARIQMRRIDLLLDRIEATDNEELPQTVLSYMRQINVEAAELSGNLVALYKQLTEEAMQASGGKTKSGRAATNA